MQRMYVVMFDTHIPFFNESLCDMDVNRKDLIYWCKFYNHNVFSLELKDRPDEFVIDYDVLLDDYLERKHFQEQSKTSSRKRVSAMEMNEVITFG